jgi:inorganic pyrophosphatase
MVKVLVETPKYSFRKYRAVQDGFIVEFTSPLPTLFNYGHIIGTQSDDGMEEDAVVLGEKLGQGQVVEGNPVMVALFTDDGLRDDKKIISPEGGITAADKIKLHFFFLAYSLYKTLYYLIVQGRLTRCGYLGLSHHRAR